MGLGLYKFVVRLAKLNYRIMNFQGKEFVVHVNRLKRAYDLGIWKANENKNVTGSSGQRRQEPEEDEPAVLVPGLLTIPASQVDNRQPAPGTPIETLHI